MIEKQINGIRGWYFTEEELSKANANNELLTIDFELGGICPLRCIYCYRSMDSRDHTDNLLSFTEWKRVIDESKELGLKSVKLIGGGEITLEKHFFQAMEYMTEKDIIPILFTAGIVIGDDELCKKIHDITGIEFAQKLYDLGMSVFIKVDSFQPELQDKLAGKKGFSVVRDKAFEILREVGFNKHNPTRLGLEVNVSRYNVHEIMDIYSLRTKYNVYEDVVISMPCEMYNINKNYDISIEQKKELYNNIYEFNRTNNISFNHISPFIGGLECSQLGNGLYITNKGDVYHCPASFNKIGSIREKSVSEIWKNFQTPSIFQNHYFCPFRENSNIIPSNVVVEMKNSIEDKS
jgi:MoaA/NifB/PqqE/SkfB family radical SAM enzyme